MTYAIISKKTLGYGLQFTKNNLFKSVSGFDYDHTRKVDSDYLKSYN